MAMTTGMRRGELLNATWKNIDFEARTIEVAPKKSSDETWEWYVKDTDRRMLPLTDEVVSMLTEHQSRQPEGHPYVFVPPCRYSRIQKLRRQGKWTYSDSRLKVINNFGRQFGKILRRAGVPIGQFHDLRRTALTNWFANGMTEKDVMALAGHANPATTHRFYLAVADDLVDRARRATETFVSRDLVQNWCSGNFSPENEKAQQP
jgi:integrase